MRPGTGTLYEPRNDKTRNQFSDHVQFETGRMMARGLKFHIKEVEGLCYLSSENKGPDHVSCTHAFAVILCETFETQFGAQIGKILKLKTNGKPQ